MGQEQDTLDELAALRLLLANSADMLSRHAPDGTYLYASPASRRLLGYDPEELVGRSAYDLFHPEDLAAIVASHEGVLDTVDVSTVEYRIRHKRGHWVWFETTSHTVRDATTGEVLEIQTSSRDVSFRKLAAARERAAERRFRLAMGNAPIGMALVDLDGRWLEVNDRLCQLLGRDEDELRSLSIGELTHPEDRELDRDEMAQLRAGEIDRYTLEKRYLHADGSEVWCQLSVAAVRGEEGQAPYLIAQVQDITERKHHEEELRQLNDQLADSNAELERFAAVASHDLRSPLATVRGLLDVVLFHADALPGEIADWLERARGQTDQLTETVDTLLELARVGHGTLVLEPADLNLLLDDTLEALQQPLADAGANLDVQWLPTVEVDRAQLRLVFQNLLDNALKFRDPDRPLRITVRSSQGDAGWAIHIEDNGAGIDPEEAAVMFDPSAAHRTAGRSDSTGIGLATCRRIIERHGGTIHAEPLQPGARVTFVLPRVGAAVGRASSP